ncbi:MAG: NAD(P)-binding domain-containing protein [Acidiferrobacterales bacterium]
MAHSFVEAADPRERLVHLRPRHVWLRVPADDSTRRTLDQMATFLSPRDIVDSGGNSDDKDPLRRAAALARHGIRCVGASVSRWYPGSGKRPCPEGG